MSVEKIQTPKTPDLNTIERQVNKSVEQGKEFLVEWTRKMEAFCERNQQAMQMFCESDKWLGQLIKKYNLTSNLNS